jgi:hypothetical protein
MDSYSIPKETITISQAMNGDDALWCMFKARNKDTTTEELRILANHTAHNVLCAVAQNENTSAETLWKLITHKNATVRYYTAIGAKNITADQLIKLAQDEFAWVRDAALGRI